MDNQTKLVFTIVLILMFLVIPFTVNGQNISFSVKPENPNIGYFQFTMNPGETKEDAIILLNFADKPQNFIVKPVDGYTADGGGIAYSFDYPNKLSKWVTTPDEGQYRLLGSRIQRIPFSITVPEGTPPGEYYLGMLTAIDESKATPEPTIAGTEQSFRVKIVGQVAIAIVITIPGEKKCNVRITDINQSILSGRWSLRASMINQGNVHFAGKGNISLVDIATNQLVFEQPISIGYFVPNTEMLFPLDFSFPENGSYRVTYDVSDHNFPGCKLSYEKDIVVGSELKDVYIEQATRIAVSLPTPSPSLSPTQSDQTSQEIRSMETPMWLLWISIIIFIIGAGLAIYAMSVIRKRK